MKPMNYYMKLNVCIMMQLGVVFKTFPQRKFYENARSTVLIFGGLVTLYTSSHELMNNQSSPHYTRKGKYTFRRY